MKKHIIVDAQQMLYQYEMVHIANVGDSRSLLVTKDQYVQQLSDDHKPEVDSEKYRIYKANGFITDQGRVNGNLNLSRTVGDLAYKSNKKLTPEEQLIISYPDYVDFFFNDLNFYQRRTNLTKNDDFILIGCDGIFENYSNEELARKINQFYRMYSTNLKLTIEQFLDSLIAPNYYSGVGCDNMSAIIIKFN